MIRRQLPGLSYRRSVLVFLCLTLLVTASLPANPALALVSQTMIDNSITQFSRGTFQRTALGSLQNTNVSPKDVSGAVQLGPLGLLKNWFNSPYLLKKPLTKLGATAIGNRLYVVGGLTEVSGSTQPVAEVWSAPVSQSTGQFQADWQAELALPGIKNATRTGYDVLISEVHSAAVTSVPKAGGGGHIYVIGGNVRKTPASTENFSSYAVRIGTVGADGHITGWVSGAPVPSSDAADATQQYGVQSPMVQTLTFNGNTYIYLIGGMRRFLAGVGSNARYVEEGLKTVFYAKVNSDGLLVRPSNGAQGWDRLPDLPVPGDYPTGLWDGLVLADHFELTSGVQKDVLYVIGGQTLPGSAPTFSSIIYRAFFGSNGALTWDSGWQGTLPQTLAAYSGVTYNGTLYAVGGLPDGQVNPDRGVLTSYVEDNLQLHLFSGNLPPNVIGGGSNFLKSPNTLPFARAYHATALVQGDGTSTSSGFVYVFGGRGDTSDQNTGDDLGSNSVFFGKLGGSEDVATTGYTFDAWYLSKPYDINFTNAQLQKIYWATTIDRSSANPDIAFEFRRSSSSTCDNAVWTNWQPVKSVESDATHQSAHGKNTSQPLDLTARCFQYRARLTTTDFLVTPSLLNVSVDIVVPGSPDLKIKTFGPQVGAGNVLLGINLLIENNNTFDTTLAADFDLPGSFFVDMCIIGPNDPNPVVDLVLPLSNANQGCSDVYADINRTLMSPFANYSVTRWLNTSGTNHDKAANLLSYFAQPGTYTVIAAVDSYNNVDEGAKGGEGNNVTKKITFTVGKIGYRVSLPVARR